MPLWVWGALAVAGVLVYQRMELASLRSEIETSRAADFQAVIEEIHGRRADEERAGVSERAARDALHAEVARNREALRLLAGRSQAAGAATARDKVAADTLVASPSCEALTEAAKRLRLDSFRCVAKPVQR